MERYAVSDDGYSITDNRTHAPVPLPVPAYVQIALVDAGFNLALALTRWAKSLNS